MQGLRVQPIAIFVFLEISLVILLINESAFSGGWICKIKMSDAGELDDLMDANTYLESLEEEE